MKKIIRDIAGTELEFKIKMKFKGIFRDLNKLNKLGRWIDSEEQAKRI